MPLERLSLLVNNEVITATLSRRRGARGLTMSVHQDGVFTLRAPLRYSIVEIERLIARKQDWLALQQKKMKAKGLSLHAKEPEQERHAYKHYKEAARRMIERRLPELNASYSFEYKRIAIKNNRTNWGSCSRTGNLNFNYKLVLLPDHLADYVIIHELCHLKEMNHSIRFWTLVAQACPDWKRCRAELKKTAIQALLHQSTPSSAS